MSLPVTLSSQAPRHRRAVIACMCTEARVAALLPPSHGPLKKPRALTAESKATDSQTGLGDATFCRRERPTNACHTYLAATLQPRANLLPATYTLGRQITLFLSGGTSPTISFSLGQPLTRFEVGIVRSRCSHTVGAQCGR
ncbi:hypothetical protein B0H12DRAFT_1148400 [Mycena haematopus]|nr:hypothetical protein B0H12DRAFT_1148400 [Mycena haematopus]